MDRSDKISKLGQELINKGYQLQGCLSNLNLAAQNRSDTDYMRQTLQEIRSMGSEVKNQADNLKIEIAKLIKNSTENETKLKKSRVELAEVKKENFKLKQKVSELESEKEMYSFDESLLSSQELPVPSQELSSQELLAPSQELSSQELPAPSQELSSQELPAPSQVLSIEQSSENMPIATEDEVAQPAYKKAKKGKKD